MELQSELNDERLTETICRLIAENYDLGKLIRVKEIIGGYCNKSYAVWILADDHTHRYFLRLYNPNVFENEILFDVGLGLVYFTSIWDDQAAGLRPDKFTLFLSTYNEACHRLTRINPMTKQERRYLVPMLSIANLYVLNWDLVDFYDTPQQDDDEYYSYIDHNIGLMHWIGLHADELELWVNNS